MAANERPTAWSKSPRYEIRVRGPIGPTTMDACPTMAARRNGPDIYPHRDAIAAQARHAPVAVESGKHKTAKFRWACNKRLRNALAWLAHSSRRWNPWAADRYSNARAHGHKHTRALRTLGRAWSRIVWSCWQHDIPYDPERHSGLQQHATVTIPTPSGPRPDLAATQRMLGDAVTGTAARRAERAALDGKPTSANALGG
jgi:hypothetical protein